jgi:hypothetical protein
MLLHLRNLLPRSGTLSLSLVFVTLISNFVYDLKSKSIKLCMWCDLTGNALFLLGHHHHHHVNNWKSSYQLEKTIRFVHNNQKRQKKIHSSLPSIDQLVNARVIYSVAPSMGHNQVSFQIIISVNWFKP